MSRIVLVLCITMFMVVSALAQDRTVDLLMQKSFPDMPGREGVMLVVNYPPCDSAPILRNSG